MILALVLTPNFYLTRTLTLTPALTLTHAVTPSLTLTIALKTLNPNANPEP